LTLEFLTGFLGWMLVVNLALFALGFAKITLFRRLSLRLTRRLFGDDSELVWSAGTNALFHFYILTILFNLTPYLVLRFLNG